MENILFVIIQLEFIVINVGEGVKKMEQIRKLMIGIILFFAIVIIAVTIGVNKSIDEGRIKGDYCKSIDGIPKYYPSGRTECVLDHKLNVIGINNGTFYYYEVTE